MWKQAFVVFFDAALLAVTSYAWYPCTLKIGQRTIDSRKNVLNSLVTCAVPEVFTLRHVGSLNSLASTQGQNVFHQKRRHTSTLPLSTSSHSTVRCKHAISAQGIDFLLISTLYLNFACVARFRLHEQGGADGWAVASRHKKMGSRQGRYFLVPPKFHWS